MIKHHRLVKTSSAVWVLKGSRQHRLFQKFLPAIIGLSCVNIFLALIAGSEGAVFPVLLVKVCFGISVLIVAAGMALSYGKVDAQMSEEDFVFDASLQVVKKGQDQYAHFREIDFIIEELNEHGSDESNPSRLIMRCHGKADCELTVVDYPYAVDMAVDLCAFVGIPCPYEKAKILDWESTETESKIRLGFESDNLCKVLGLALDADTPYSHEDIAMWCDNFYCEYLDQGIVSDVDRMMPVLEEIREQWDAVAVSTHKPSFSSEAIHRWLGALQC